MGNIMMKPTYSIAIAAIVILAAIAGVAMVADESDAADVGDIDTVQYKIGGAVYEADINGDSFTVELPEEYSGDAKVLYWTGADGKTYYAGQVVYLSDIDAIYANGSAFRLTAATEAEGAEYATVVIEGVSYVIALSEDKLDTSDVAYKDAKAVYDALMDAGYSEDWDPSNPFADETEVSADSEYTLTTGIGTVVWVVDGTVIGTYSVEEDGTVSVPDAPSKQYYAFAGWSMTNGGAVAIEYIASTGEYHGAGVTGDKDTGYTISVADTDSDSGSVTFYAVFQAEMYTVTFMAGENVVAEMSVAYGKTVAALPELPSGYSAWDFDMATVITGDLTVYAIASEVYNVSFQVDGVIIATYKSTAITVPADPVKEGYDFLGWYIGTERIADPTSYAYTQDTVLVASFQAIDVEFADVTFGYADGTSETVTVPVGETVALPAVAEGNVWAYDGKVYEGGAVSEDMALTEVREFYTVTFTINGLTYQTVQVRYGETVAEPEYQYAGYEGWDFDFSAPIYADTAVAAAVEVIEEAPAFYETTTGQIAIVLIVFIVLLFGYAVYSNMFGLRDKLSRKDKDKEE